MAHTLTDETRRAQELLNGRYGRLRTDASAEGWYSAELIPQNLGQWSELLGPVRQKAGWAVELGCGAGNLALDLSGSGWQVVGIDVSEQAVEWARSRAADAGFDAEFLALDLGAPLPAEVLGRFGGRFDLVIDSDCLHYVLGDRRATFLRNAHDLLAREGTFVVRTIVGQPDPEEWAMLEYAPETRTSRISGVPMVYCAEADEVLQELTSAGFVIRESRILPKEGDHQPNNLLVAYAAATSSKSSA